MPLRKCQHKSNKVAASRELQLTEVDWKWWTEARCYETNEKRNKEKSQQQHWPIV